MNGIDPTTRARPVCWSRGIDAPLPEYCDKIRQRILDKEANVTRP